MQSSAIKALEDQFYQQVNAMISEKLTPVYNFFTLVFAAGFAYFLVMEQP